jgi:hypothetical protein
MGSALDAVTPAMRDVIEHREYNLADQLLDRRFLHPGNLNGSQ